MVDNVAITAGTGTTIAADDIGSGVLVQRVKPVWGADGSATDPSRSAPFPVEAGITVRVSDSFTRPADTTAYAIGDLVANSTTAGSVTKLTFANVVRQQGGGGMLRRARLRKSGVATSNAVFRLHLWSASPATVTNGDNGAFSISGSADYLGAIDITIDQAFTDGAVGYGIPRVGGEINLDIPSTGTTIYGLLEARAAYTPTSAEVFAVEVEIVQD